MTAFGLWRSHTSRWQSSACLTSLLLGGFTVAVGSLVFLGWVANANLLKPVVPGLISMNPMTAFAFILAGYSLLMVRSESRLTPSRSLLANSAAALVLLIGLSKVCALVAGHDYSVDRLFFSSRLAIFDPGIANRMAPNTAFNLVLIGAALLLIDTESKQGHRPAEVLAVVCSISALLAVLGYAYSVTSFYKIGHHVPMALSTAATFIALSLGILLARYDKGITAIVASDTAGGFMARRLLPIAILLPIGLGTLHLFGERARFYESGFGAALYGTCVVMVFLGAIWWTTRLLFQIDTERQEAEQIRKEHEQRFSQLAAHIDDIFWMSNPERSHFLYVSPAFERIWGKHVTDVYANPLGWTEAIHPDDRQRVITTFREKAWSGTYNEEFRLTRPDGAVRWIRDRAFPITHLDGTVYRLAGVASDITDRKRVGDALQQSRDELEQRVRDRTLDLEQVNAQLRKQIAERARTEEALRSAQEQFVEAQKMEALGQLAGGVAHDFNNMLTAIMGYGTLLFESLPREQREQSHVAEILHSAERAAALSKQLLAFSRRDNYQPTVLHLGNVVENVKKLILQVIGERIHLVTDVEANLASVRADAGQLDQVLLNLAINARDAMPRGGTITISARNVVLPHEAVRAETDSSDFVALSVRDEGTGIPPELISRIFEPFFTTKPPGQGTGLGLATCSAIAEKAGGWIACASEPGKGTQFTIYLPAVDERAIRLSPPRYDGDLPHGKETVLVVEDEPAVGELLSLLLDNLGYDVVRAEDGAQAEAAIAEREGSIDLVLTDLNMPRMDGRELIERLCARNSSVKLILTSGNELSDLEEAPDVAFDFLPKPFTMQSLAKKVREVLDA